ncbi:MAG: cysteine desulfurase [Lachnospira sp.]|nr:cysteine desulfurase [Lachnospira sp.]
MIYMDNAATTKVHPAVVNAMIPYMSNRYSNPSGIYTFSKNVKRDIEDARAVVAAAINALPEEIYFTSGGTESDNWALKMSCLERGRGHIITTQMEHHAILKSCEQLQSQGIAVTKLKPDKDGIVTAKSVEKAIRPDTVLVSIMAANNEIGTLQPVKDIGAITREYGVLFHTDAVQAFTNIDIDVKAMNINMLSASGHKISGPKGVGFLYVEKDKLRKPFINGGGQEMGLRAGTENVAGIIGLAKATKIAVDNMKVRTEYERKMRDYMTDRVLREIKGVHFNGHSQKRLPGNMNFSFEYVDGATLILMLDRQGICASAGSACSSVSSEPSHVLKSIGLSDELAYGSVRFTINEKITKREIDYVIECLKQNVAKLRSMNTEWNNV